MTRSLSNDLRHRLVAAVDGGMSRRSAAKVFGVAPSTAIKWVDQWRRRGDVRPRPQGGDRRSHRLEAYAEQVLALVADPPSLHDDMGGRPTGEMRRGSADSIRASGHKVPHQKAGYKTAICLPVTPKLVLASRETSIQHRHHGQSASP